MCGIAGIFASHIPGDFDLRQACLKMLGKLEHRGPDGNGLYEDDHLILGHTRLAVIDLSKEADQPISNESGTIWLSFNGEIYNFRSLRDQLVQNGHHFRSNTDSEVIVHLYEEYGTACLDRLDGMFAFAIWDSIRKQLFLARDRLGIKPLYYAETSRTFVFASEIQALLASGLIPGTVNDKAFIQFLQYGSIPSPSTSFKNVFCLPAGHCLLKDATGVSITPYWSLEECLGRNTPLDGHNETDDIRGHLCRIMKNHLVSDVPLAICLSGGIDSSSLVAASREVSKGDLHTLTIAFESEEHDESSFARTVSNTFGTVHHEHLITSEDFAANLDAFVGALDQPTIDGFNTFMISETAKRLGFRVLVSGLGGDEVFGGYAHFRNLKFLFRALAISALMPKVIRETLLTGLTKAAGLMGWSSAERFGYLQDPSRASAYRVYRGLFPPSLIQEMAHCRFEDLPLAVGSRQNSSLSELDSAFDFEFNHYLHDQLLRDTDVMSMRHSIEMRVPYLDHELVSAVLSLPAKRRFVPRRPKVLLKKAFQPFLPDLILRRKKRGFIFPLSDWMRSSLKSNIEEVLFDPSPLPMGLNSEGAHKVWMLFLRGRLHWSLPWALYIFKRWQREKLASNQLVRTA